MSGKNQNMEWVKSKYNEYSELIVEEFNRHPKKHKMNCGQHFIVAMKSALWSFGAGLIFTVHAILPMVFETTGSDMISSLNKVFEERDKCLEQPYQPQPPQQPQQPQQPHQPREESHISEEHQEETL